jgi:DNA-binding PadR family transcriptional regulator
MAHTHLAEDSTQEWMRGSSELKGPLLALLLERPGYPYDLAGRLRKRLGSAWEFADKDIYKILERFVRQGLAVSYRTDSKRSSKRITMYEPTDLTREAVAEWMRSPLPEEPVRGAVWARIAFSEPEDAPRLLQALDEYQRTCFRLLKDLGERYPVDTWRGMEMELARRGAGMRLEAALDWIDLARGFIANFPGARDVPAGL